MTHTLRLRDHLYRFHTGAFWRGPESVWHPSLIGVKVVFQTRFCLKKSSSWGSCKLWYGLQLIWKKLSLICGNGLLSLSNMHNKAIKKLSISMILPFVRCSNSRFVLNSLKKKIKCIYTKTVQRKYLEFDFFFFPQRANCYAFYLKKCINLKILHTATKKYIKQIIK